MEGIRGEVEEESKDLKMEKWRGWLRFKHSVLCPTKFVLLKVKTRLGPKANGKMQGLLSLYKDMETCGEYEDIQVMWKMIHSSCPSNSHKPEESKGLLIGDSDFVLRQARSYPLYANH
ncbi:hypothetical protein REPUB_Repub02eG0285100 [Reevesia pubescens]